MQTLQLNQHTQISQPDAVVAYDDQRPTFKEGVEFYIQDGMTSVFLDDLPKTLSSIELYDFLSAQVGPVDKILLKR